MSANTNLPEGSFTPCSADSGLFNAPTMYLFPDHGIIQNKEAMLKSVLIPILIALSLTQLRCQIVCPILLKQNVVHVISGDTINAGDCIELDSNVYSFRVDCFKDGVLSEFEVNGNSFCRTFQFPRGSKIILDQILATSQPGYHVRKPAVTIYIR